MVAALSAVGRCGLVQGRVGNNWKFMSSNDREVMNKWIHTPASLSLSGTFLKCTHFIDIPPSLFYPPPLAMSPRIVLQKVTCTQILGLWFGLGGAQTKTEKKAWF